MVLPGDIKTCTRKMGNELNTWCLRRTPGWCKDRWLHLRVYDVLPLCAVCIKRKFCVRHRVAGSSKASQKTIFAQTQKILLKIRLSMRARNSTALNKPLNIFL